jgi:hypothetical protein
MKKLGLFLAGILLVIIADAQTDDFTSQLIKVLPLSPNAAALGKFGNQPVGCYTGVANVSVPIYIVESGDIKVPLTLNYHTGGVKVEDIASWVGTGWSFSFGGSINRQLRGLPDEDGGYLTDNTAIDQFNDWSIEQKETYVADAKLGTVDPQNDIFSYNFGGQSGKFFFKPNGEVVSKPQNKIHFEYGNYFSRPGWKVTNTDGLTYYFLDRDETSSLTTALPASGDGIDVFSSWYISKIVSPQGTESVDFEYELQSISYNSLLSQTVYLLDPQDQADADDAGMCGNQAPSLSRTFTSVLEARLKKIKFTNGEVIINSKAEERTDLTGSHALESIQIMNSEGREIKRFDFAYTTISNDDGPEGKRLYLDAVQLSANSVSLGAYRFEYVNRNGLPGRESKSQDYWGYYNGVNNSTLIPYCGIFKSNGKSFPYLGADRTPNPAAALAGSLEKVFYPTGGYTEFTMESNTANNAASVMELGYDFNGGTGRFQIFGDAGGSQTEYNGSFSVNEGYGGLGGVMANIEIGLPNSDAIPPPPAGDGDPVIQLTEPDGSVINLRNNVPIFLPLGNYNMHVDFSSNPDPTLIRNFYVIITYTYGVRDNPEKLKNLVVGGLRVKTIKDVDPISGHTYVRNYSYLQDDGITSTGVLGSFPSYKGIMLECRNQGLVFCHKITLGSISESSLLLTQSSYVGYRMVDELFDDGNNGKNRYVYTTAIDFDDVGNYKVYPYPIPDSRDEFRGILLDKQTFKKISNKYVPVSEKSYKYNFAGTGYSPDDPFTVVTKGWSFRQYYFGCSTPSSSPRHYYNQFTTTSGFIKLLSETNRTYDQDNPSKYSEVVTSYEYSDKNLQVNKVTSKQSNDDLSVVTYKFALDYNFTAAATDNKVKGIAALVAQYKINEPVETSFYNSQNGGALQLVNSKCTLFDPVVGNPGAILTLDIKGPVNDFTPSTIQSDNLVMDNRYTPKINFNKYLSNGRLVQQQKANDVLKSYLWDYNGTYSIAEITNADVSQTAYTSFETDDLGRWSLNAGSTILTNNGSVTGKRSLNGGVNTTVSQGTYVLSLWSATTPVVNGQPVSAPPRKSPGTGKSFYQVELTDISSVNVTGDNIDEIRLYPKGAEMTTVTYEPLVGITSQSDTRGYINYYEYDDAGRFSVIRDEAGNVVKSINYHYLNQ